MANRVRMGSTYLTEMLPNVITRYGGCPCWNCNDPIEAESLAISKRRGGKQIKHYCLRCALFLHIVTKAELEAALYAMGIPSDKIEEIMLEAMR